MARKVKLIPAPGRTLSPILTSGCNWCLYGTCPDDKGICQTCVQSFKRLLCSQQWLKLRLAILSEHPYCTFCQSQGILHLANEIDHIKDWRFRPDLFWDETNLRPLAKECHKILTEIQKANGFKEI